MSVLASHKWTHYGGSTDYNSYSFITVYIHCRAVLSQAWWDCYIFMNWKSDLSQFKIPDLKWDASQSCHTCDYDIYMDEL